MGQKICTSKEFMASHIMIIVGLILITVGLALGLNKILFLIGMWVGVAGFCSLSSTAFKKLMEK